MATDDLPAAEPGEYYRLKHLPSGNAAPTVLGQGRPPSALVIVSNGKRYELPFGGTFKASAHCDSGDDGEKVASLDRNPPLLRCRIIDQMRDQFEHLPDA